jgi:hypothetical protein
MTQTVTTTRTFEFVLAGGTTGDLKAEVDAMVARTAVGTDSIVKSVHSKSETEITVVVQKPDNP